MRGLSATHVTSADGTRIAVHRRGAGRPLVLVHGAASDHRVWDALAPLLEDRFALHLMDRRGHGDSDRGPDPHTLRAEGEDVAAVLDAAGDDAWLLAHSWGARCALTALLQGARPQRAVVYEPLDTEQRLYDDAALERLAHLEATAAPDELLPFFFTAIAGIPDAALDRVRGTAEWDQAAGAAGTLARESHAHWAEPFVPGDFAAVPVPVTLLLGELSLAGYTRTAHGLVDALPHAELVTLPRHGHVAHIRAPQLVAAALDQPAA